MRVRDGESLESALGRLKRELQLTGKLKEARRHERYEKPSDKKRRERNQARRRPRGRGRSE